LNCFCFVLKQNDRSECDNDVLDNQVVSMKFDSGATVTFTCVAFSKDVCQRRTTFFGELGEIQGDGEDCIRHTDFVTGTTKAYYASQIIETPTSSMLGGHGGGDFHLIHNFVAAVRHQDQSLLACTVRQALESHLLVFDAEAARHQNSVIQLGALPEW
jgi:predicted dehydrogenase